MIEDALIQYGVLGVWTVSLLAERYYYTTNIRKVVENNTIALTQNTEVTRKCQKK